MQGMAGGGSSAAAGAGAWTVAALMQAVADALQERIGACRVQGELGGLTRAASGHWYFTLKDETGSASMRCVMFRRAAGLVDFEAREGLRVEISGRMAVYEPRGDLQFIAEAMRLAGAGALYEEFLRRRARLEAQGLFDAARKRPLPAMPTCIGVVTSASGAVFHDIRTALARRAPHVRLILYPSAVQGAAAPAALVQALAAAGARDEVDLLIIARGGGSLEDLWAFNDEALVHAVASFPRPVISGVGHETDFTLCDLAADLRAPTPTAAAEMASPASAELRDLLAGRAAQVRRLMAVRLDREAQRLDRAGLRLSRPGQALRVELQKLHEAARRLPTAAQRQVQELQQALSLRATRLRQGRPAGAAATRARLGIAPGEAAGAGSHPGAGAGLCLGDRCPGEGGDDIARSGGRRSTQRAPAGRRLRRGGAGPAGCRRCPARAQAEAQVAGVASRASVQPAHPGGDRCLECPSTLPQPHTHSKDPSWRTPCPRFRMPSTHWLRT